MKTETENKFPNSLYDLIDQLLVMNPNNRLTIKGALSHAFFSESPDLNDPKCDPKNIPQPKSDCHEYIVRAELAKRNVADYKKFFTFKHNIL